MTDDLSQRDKNRRDIKVSGEGLPRNYPERGWALDQRRFNRKAYLIYISWLEAEDKDESITESAERFGYLNRGAVERIIERVKLGEIGFSAAVTSRLDAIREVKRNEIHYDSERRLAHLESRLRELGELKDEGGEWADVEQSDKVGFNAGTTTKRVPLDKLIREVYAEMAQAHKDEAAALDMYMVKPVQKIDHSGEIRITDEIRREKLKEGLRQFGVPVSTDT